jgi:hypothetical protein
MTERACFPEPPCDCLILMTWPVRAFHEAANAVSTAS